MSESRVVGNKRRCVFTEPALRLSTVESTHMVDTFGTYDDVVVPFFRIR
jgi:hypothetical protein